MQREKRGYTRYSGFDRQLNCSRCDVDDVRVEVSDISCDGIGISTTERLMRGDLIELELNIPGDDIPMFIVGKVAWVREHPTGGSTYCVGLRMAKINHSDKERLISFIDSSFIRK